MRLGHFLETVEKVVQQVAGSGGDWDESLGPRYGRKLVASSVGKRVTLMVRGTLRLEVEREKCRF